MTTLSLLLIFILSIPLAHSAQKKLKKFVHDSMLLETSKFIKLIYC